MTRARIAAICAAIAVLGLASTAGADCLCADCDNSSTRPFEITGGNMKPAVEPGACLTVDTTMPPKRGDIVIFLNPKNGKTAISARLIGLPGDVVQMQDGQVILNGAPLPQTPAEPYMQVMQLEGPARSKPRCPKMTASGATCAIPRLTETLPEGGSYDILDLDPRGKSDTTKAVTMPADQVFVLGDNRDNSNDSRLDLLAGGLGLIPASIILGPVVKITNP
ncbi:MAG: signal peptidase I [Rhodobacter sp.]|jgi:signal peptidase I|nr:signal peptidase I [Rhodobacter sp.]MBK8441382.1 signal peptidase I [Rhodobacter sp.]